MTVEQFVDTKLAEWVKTNPKIQLVDTFEDDHIACAEFTIDESGRTYRAYWIGSENVGAFKYAQHYEEALNDVVQVIRDKVLSTPLEVDDHEYNIAIAVGITHDNLLSLGMLDE